MLQNKYHIGIAAAALSVGLISAVPSIAQSPISFTDQKKKTIKLNKPVTRVVTIPIPAASMFMAVDGGTKRLVGMHHLSKTAIKGNILQKFFPDALNITSNIVGKGFTFIPNVEELLSLNPDIVFQWSHLGDDIIKPIENAGMKVASIRIGKEAFTIKWLQMMGAMLGKSEKTDAMIKWRHDTRAMLAKHTSGIPEDKRPRVLYFMNYLSKLRVAGGKSYNNFYINLAGGKNSAGGLGMIAVVSAEQIIAWNPEVILLNGFERKLSPKDVYNNPLLADVSAVKNKRVYKMPLGGYRWDPPNQESPLTWLWLSMVLHPEKFSWPLRKVMDEKYRFIYGQGLSDGDIDAILKMKMNGTAANYRIFTRQ